MDFTGTSFTVKETPKRVFAEKMYCSEYSDVHSFFFFLIPGMFPYLL